MEVEKKLKKRTRRILLQMIWGKPSILLHFSLSELREKAYLLAVYEHMTTWYD